MDIKVLDTESNGMFEIRIISLGDLSIDIS